ncbi:radical SAM protein, partial [Segatella buccae]|uniref:radical SAM protein n=1 Tax=Segatella buccae TaxID=28126 RepID=UPI0006606D2D
IYKVYGPCEGEITLECNPDDVTDDFCHALARLPVNRVSMGAQTFSDARLRFLHRRHSAAEVVTAVERLRRADIRNISLDLMFGFPGETRADWQTDIDNALQLHPEHLSAYSLMYEEG